MWTKVRIMEREGAVVFDMLRRGINTWMWYTAGYGKLRTRTRTKDQFHYSYYYLQFGGCCVVVPPVGYPQTSGLVYVERQP